jgi:hypothetical protein
MRRITLRPIENKRGWHVVGDVVTCPVCGRRSVYNRDEDLFFHQDGSASTECWCAITRGGLIPQPIMGGACEPRTARQAA